MEKARPYQSLLHIEGTSHTEESNKDTIVVNRLLNTVRQPENDQLCGHGQVSHFHESLLTALFEVLARERSKEVSGLLQLGAVILGFCIMMVIQIFGADKLIFVCEADLEIMMLCVSVSVAILKLSMLTE